MCKFILYKIKLPVITLHLITDKLLVRGSLVVFLTADINVLTCKELMYVTKSFVQSRQYTSRNEKCEWNDIGCHNVLSFIQTSLKRIVINQLILLIILHLALQSFVGFGFLNKVILIFPVYLQCYEAV